MNAATLTTSKPRNKYQYGSRAEAEQAARNADHRAYVYGRAIRAMHAGSASVFPMCAKSVDGEEFTASVIRYRTPAGNTEAVAVYCFGSSTDGKPSQYIATADEFVAMCDREVSALGRDYEAMGYFGTMARHAMTGL